MKLSLKNIGKIETASVEINGITVIAGENNTGKSTVGRALFAVFNSFYNIQKQIESERVQNIENLIDIMYRNVTNRYTRRFDSREIAQKIVAQIYLYKDDTEAVKDLIVKTILQYDENFEKHIDDNSIDEYIVRIKDGLNVADLVIFKSVLEKKLDAEFAGEVNNIFTDKTGEIVLSIKDTNIIVTIEDNAVKSVVGKMRFGTPMELTTVLWIIVDIYEKNSIRKIMQILLMKLSPAINWIIYIEKYQRLSVGILLKISVPAWVISERTSIKSLM